MLKYIFIAFINVSISVYFMCIYALVAACCGGQRTTCGSWFSLSRNAIGILGMAPRPCMRLGSKYLYPLSHFIDLQYVFWCWIYLDYSWMYACALFRYFVCAVLVMLCVHFEFVIFTWLLLLDSSRALQVLQ